MHPETAVLILELTAILALTAFICCKLDALLDWLERLQGEWVP